VAMARDVGRPASASWSANASVLCGDGKVVMTDLDIEQNEALANAVWHGVMQDVLMEVLLLVVCAAKFRLCKRSEVSVRRRKSARVQ